MKIIDHGLTDAKLLKAVLLYGRVEAFSNQRAPLIATVHDVDCEGDRPIIRAGLPATKAQLADFAKQLSIGNSHGGVLPPNLLALGPEHIVWYCRPTIRTMFFKLPSGTYSGRCSQPGLVFAVSAQELMVFAVKGARRPKASTTLFHAPYFNVWEYGNVCTGTTVMPDGRGPDCIKKLEDAFFASAFTHPNHQHLLKAPGRGGFDGFWKRRLKVANTPFPSEHLVKHPTLKTVDALINAVERGI